MERNSFDVVHDKAIGTTPDTMDLFDLRLMAWVVCSLKKEEEGGGGGGVRRRRQSDGKESERGSIEIL